MKKKKLLALGMVAALGTTAVVGGTLAYFTDTDYAENVFEVGNVSIVQNEFERETENGAYKDTVKAYENNKTLMPAVYNDYNSKQSVTVDGTTVKIRDKVGNYVDKIVNVTNDGKSDAYVRTIFAFPEVEGFDTTYNANDQWFHWNAVSDTDTNPTNGWYWGKDPEAGQTRMEWPANTDNWDSVENVTINGKIYDIYVATNENILASGKTTAPSLLGLFLDHRVDCETVVDKETKEETLNFTFKVSATEKYNLGDISNLDVLVISQATQTEGFDNAWEALDAAFGDVNATNAKAWFEETFN